MAGINPPVFVSSACEDNSTWRVITKDGKDVTPKNQPDYIQSFDRHKISRLLESVGRFYPTGKDPSCECL